MIKLLPFAYVPLHRWTLVEQSESIRYRLHKNIWPEEQELWMRSNLTKVKTSHCRCPTLMGVYVKQQIVLNQLDKKNITSINISPMMASS